MLRKKNASCLRSFKHSNFSPYKMWRYKNKYKHEVNPVLLYKKNLESHSLSRQKLPNTFNHIGIVDILRPKKTILQNSICGNVVVPLLIFIVKPLTVFSFTATETVHVVDVDIVFGIDTLSRESPFAKVSCCILGLPEILVKVAAD
jgi:hypothetical protein